MEIISKNLILKQKIYFYLDKNRKDIKTFRSTKIDRTLMILLLIFLDLKDFRELNDTIQSNDNVIEEAVNNIIKSGINETQIVNFFENDIKESRKLEKISLVDAYLSSNKYMLLVPDNLKIKYVIDNKLDVQGIKNFLEIRK